MIQFEVVKDEVLQQIKTFCQVSEEQTKSMEKFISLLLQENKNFNFIGKSTVDNVLTLNEEFACHNYPFRFVLHLSIS